MDIEIAASESTDEPPQRTLRIGDTEYDLSDRPYLFNALRAPIVGIAAVAIVGVLAVIAYLLINYAIARHAILAYIAIVAIKYAVTGTTSPFLNISRTTTHIDNTDD